MHNTCVSSRRIGVQDSCILLYISNSSLIAAGVRGLKAVPSLSFLFMAIKSGESEMFSELIEAGSKVLGIAG